MDVSTRQMRAFVAVARTLSFTQAAAELHLSQPALTVQIRGLERQLGGKLFDRNSRSVELSRLGADILPAFQKVLRDLDQTVAGVRDLTQNGGGSVRIACLPSFAAGFLPEVIVAFRRRHPKVSLTVKDAIASRVMDLVVAEEADLGITGGEAIHPDLDIVATAMDRLHVVFPKSHPLARSAGIGVEELTAYPLILMDPATSVRSTVDAVFAADALRVDAACEVTYMTTAVAMVRAGLGITVLPASAQEIRTEPAIASRPIDDPRFARPVALVRKRRRSLLPVADDLILTIASSFAGLPRR